MDFQKIYKGATSIQEEKPEDKAREGEKEQVRQAEELERQIWLQQPYTTKFLKGLLDKDKELTEEGRQLSLDRTKREELADTLKETIVIRKVISYARANKYSND